MKHKPSLGELAATQTTFASLAQEATEIARLILEAGGELSPELEKRLEVNQDLLPRKVDAYVFIQDHLDAQAALWKRRKDACGAMQKRFETRYEQLRGRVKDVMQLMGVTEIKGALHRYKLISQKAPKASIVDETMIPASFKMQVTTTIVNMDLVKQALLDGFEVPGAALETVAYVRDYENDGE